MPTGYQIYNQSECYFLTLQVVDWVDVFTRKEYVDIILNSFNYGRKHKVLILWSYVIMSNHVHMIAQAKDKNLSDILRDFKRHTATQILKAIDSNKESRRYWMLKRFEFMAKRHKRNSKHQFWKHQNHAIQIDSDRLLRQKMAYIHLNPVRAGFVDSAEHWMYSSQRNYANLDALIEIDMMDI